jgi:hypothetical protein
MPQECAECERLKLILLRAINTYGVEQLACSAASAEAREFDLLQARRIAADFAWQRARHDLVDHERTHNGLR